MGIWRSSRPAAGRGPWQLHRDAGAALARAAFDPRAVALRRLRAGAARARSRAAAVGAGRAGTLPVVRRAHRPFSCPRGDGRGAAWRRGAGADARRGGLAVGGVRLVAAAARAARCAPLVAARPADAAACRRRPVAGGAADGDAPARPLDSRAGGRAAAGAAGMGLAAPGARGHGWRRSQAGRGDRRVDRLAGAATDAVAGEPVRHRLGACRARKRGRATVRAARPLWSVCLRRGRGGGAALAAAGAGISVRSRPSRRGGSGHRPLRSNRARPGVPCHS